MNEVLEWNISSDFGLFKKGNNWKNGNFFSFYTYLCPHIPNILGMLGACFGYKGYKELQNYIYELNNIKKTEINKIKLLNNKIENFKLDFYEYFKSKNLYIGIKINNLPILKNYDLSNTVKTGIVTKKNTIYIWKNEVIENPSYNIYLTCEDKDFLKKLEKKINNPHYTINMGKNRFPIINSKTDLYTCEITNNTEIEKQFIIKENDIYINNNGFISITENIPFSFNGILHTNFSNVFISFDEKTKVNKNKDNLILKCFNNQNIILYKVN